MALPRDYAEQPCSLARTLEIVGERWTLLIVRDAFYGARSFGEFADHLKIPRAVLTDRLNALVGADVLQKVAHGRRFHYELTPKGISLWPTVHALIQWGDEHYAPRGPRRLFLHAADEQLVDTGGVCTGCGQAIAPTDIIIKPGPGAEPAHAADDSVTVALREPHRLLQPLR
jgi:DNA-binding HxlR family transcriptional regulator